MNRFKNLTAPLEINGVLLKSHIYSSCALPHFLQGPETYPTEALLTFLSSVAENGAAILTMDACDGYPKQRYNKGSLADNSHMPLFDLRDDGVHNSLSAMADEIHFHGSKLFLKAELQYPEGYSLNGGQVFDFLQGRLYDTRAIPEALMPEMIAAFVEKVRLYRSFGYDGLSIRTDHYVGFSPEQRTDAYGGSVENRTRLLCRCLEAVKRELGRGFLIEAVMAGELPFGYGGDFDARRDENGEKILSTVPRGSYSLEDAIEFLKAAEGLVDIVQLRERDAFLAQPTTYNFKGRHETVRYAEAIRAAGCRVLTAPNGGFQDPCEIEAYLAEKQCDLISMGRAFIADPQYYQKIREGRPEDITPCLKCSKCHGTISAPWISFCSVNPGLGLQHKLHRLIREPQEALRVAVIGGGPAGMQAALTAARRGHSVTLFEKENRLGGQLLHADYFSFKRPLLQYKRWLTEQLEKAGVSVRLNSAPEPEELQGKYDALIAATGSEHLVPDICDNMPEGLPTCWDVIGKAQRLGKSAVILGGSQTGVETGMYLAEAGLEVTVLTRQKALAKDAPPLHNITMDHVARDASGHIRTLASWENYAGFHAVCGARYLETGRDFVRFLDSEGQERTIFCDTVIVSGGTAPRQREALRYAGCAKDFYAVGECNGMRNLQQCGRDAFARASQI